MMKRFLILVCLLLAGPCGYAFAAAAPLNVDVDRGIDLTLSAPASSVFIANPDIADVQVMSPTSIMIFGKRTGETTFMATDAEGHTLSQRTVVVSQDLAGLRRELDIAMPGNKIEVQPLPNGIMLTGEAHDPAVIADAYKLAQRYLPSSGGDIINRIKVVGSNQINIRVRFAEVSRSVDSTLGIDWQSFGNIGGMVFGFGTGNAVIDSTTNALFPRPSNSSLTRSNDVFGLSHQGKNLNINGMLDALAEDGLVTILAEPNLTAMSGETASFLAGGEIPVPVPQSSSGSNPIITVQWKNYGISLEFTPTLISGDRINLHVKPEVSELTNIGSITTDGITIPGLTTRKAETTVEVASGQSFAIAGLLDNNQSQTVDEFPILGDLPILGPLFRSNHFQNGQSELLVVITPYIVKPTGEEIALPMDGYSPPNEAERFLGLRYSSANPNARPMSGAPTAQLASPVPQTIPQTPAGDTGNAPAPMAAPVAPVTLGPKSANPALLQPPALSNSPNAAPAGPGGFILE